jgi:hypothetical protein
MYKYSGTDGKVRSADIEYKVLGENKFRISTRPTDKLVIIIPMEEQTMEDEWEPAGGEVGDVPEPKAGDATSPLPRVESQEGKGLEQS